MSVKSFKTICVLPWIHTAIFQNKEVRPCCTAPDLTLGSIEKNSISYIDNDVPMQTLRQQMMDGVRPDCCSVCFSREEAGTTSPRMNFNKEYYDDFTKIIKEEPVSKKYLEVNFSNLCNARCRMCSPQSSTRWYADAASLQHLEYYNFTAKGSKDVDFAKFDVNWKELDLIKILGGEPFLTPDNEKIIHYISTKGNPKNVRLEIFTNSSIFPTKKVIEQLKEFKKVEINLSIDGLNDTYNYIRWPLIFDDIIPVAQKWIDVDIPNKQIGVQFLVQVDNILQVVEFDKFFKVLGGFDGNTDKMYIHYNIISRPEHLLPRNAKDKVKAIAYLEEYLNEQELQKRDVTKFNAIIQELKREPAEKDLKQLAEFNKILDGTR
jgi:MoaA/NifB/PqqE/SkfB family radical SAM enzyme